MTLNGILAVILRYFTEFRRFRGGVAINYDTRQWLKLRLWQKCSSKNLLFGSSDGLWWYFQRWLRNSALKRYRYPHLTANIRIARHCAAISALAEFLSVLSKPKQLTVTTPGWVRVQHCPVIQPSIEPHRHQPNEATLRRDRRTSIAYICNIIIQHCNTVIHGAVDHRNLFHKQTRYSILGHGSRPRSSEKNTFIVFFQLVTFPMPICGW